jgi:uncharacterized protein YjiS (DUF1127 family)
MEMIMNPTTNTDEIVAGTASPHTGLLTRAKGWWQAWIAWRVQMAAIERLAQLSDRELKDIGLTRTEIRGAVRGDHAAERSFVRYY